MSITLEIFVLETSYFTDIYASMYFVYAYQNMDYIPSICFASIVCSLFTFIFLSSEVFVFRNVTFYTSVIWTISQVLFRWSYLFSLVFTFISFAPEIFVL